MATDEERREVARRLRRADADGLDYETAWCWVLDDALATKGLGWPETFECLADLIEPQPVTGKTSDGYHTFDELYDHRAKLFSVIVRDYRGRAWKSLLHHDGTMYDGMFIVGIETPDGQATYHYDVDPYWSMFDCEVLERAPEWDGHTPQQAIDRIAALRPVCDREALLGIADIMEGSTFEYDGDDGAVRDFASFAEGITRFYASLIREACGEEVG